MCLVILTKAPGSLKLHWNSVVDDEVSRVMADFLPPERYFDRKFHPDPQPTLPAYDFHCAGMDGFQKPVSEFLVDFVKKLK